MTTRTDVTSDSAGDPTTRDAARPIHTTHAAAVLAVKDLAAAKSRLAPTSTPRHRALVMAMFLDTVTTITEAGIDQVVVVSPDPTVRAAARRFGVVAVSEQPHPAGTTASTNTGLNAALARGSDVARQRWPHVTRMLLIQADLPSVTAQSIREALDAAAPYPQAMVTDRSGVGTALLIRDTDRLDPPLFGADSAAAHRDSGVVELDPDHRRWPDLRTDVDTADDLAAATALGLGSHTATALTGLG